MKERIKMVKFWLIVTFVIMFIWPRWLDELAFWMRLFRGIAAYMVLKIWMKGGNMSGMISSPLHRWLRSVTNGRTKKAAQEFLDRLDFPEYEK